MTDSHPIFQENLAAYALGALDADEALALQAHLQTCESCRAQLAEYQRLSAGLLAALPPRAPGRNLKRTLQRRLAGESRAARPQSGWPLGQTAMAAALVLMLALNIFSVFQVYSLRQQQAGFTGRYESEQTAIAMLAYPGTQSITFDQSGVSGSLLVDKKRNLLAVFTWNLPPPPAGQTYQMWLIDPRGDRTSGGFLLPEADEPFVMAVIASPQPLVDFIGLGVTLEPLGGSPKPTGPKILRVDFN
jgi:anti-sigma-K factor RskA